MNFDNLMGLVRLPLCQTDGGSGGGAPAGGGAPSGGNPSGGQPTGNNQPASGNSGGQPNSGGAPTTASEPLEWDDNRQFRVKGKDQPISAKDYVRGFQSQATKANQELARIKKEHAAAQQQLQRFQQAGQGQNPQGGNQQGDAMLGEIESAPFIDGKQMGAIVRDFQAGIRERDQIVYAALNRLSQMEQVLGQLHGTNLNQQHEGKLKTWLKGVGLDGDQDAFELADIIYRGYEGDNLDEEFPQIFEQRWKQMQGVVQRRIVAERQRQRQLPWVPGKGGNAGPGQPQGLTGRESPKELADIFFKRYGGGSET